MAAETPLPTTEASGTQAEPNGTTDQSENGGEQLDGTWEEPNVFDAEVGRGGKSLTGL